MSLSKIFVNSTQIVGVDNEPTVESDNLVKSGGVFNSIVSTDLGLSLRGGNTGEGGQSSYFLFDALPAGDYYIVINSANDLQNIFVGLATGGGNQYITQKLIDDKPITAGNHYFKVTLTGSETRLKVSIAFGQNITPVGITWSINGTKTSSLTISETAESDRNKEVIALRENIGSESSPEYKTTSSVTIGAASKTKAGVMTADDRINQLNVVEYNIDTDVAVSDDLQYLTPALETLKGEDVTAFELEIIEKTFITNTYECLGVSIDGRYNSINNVGKYSNKLFFFGSGNQDNFRLYVRSNVVTTAGHFKAKLRIYQKSNTESLIFSYDLLSVDGLDNTNVIISPIIYSFSSPYAKFKIKILENTIGVVSEREKQYLAVFLGGNTYKIITLDDNNSEVVECSQGTPAFCIVLRSVSVNSIGRIVFSINLNVEKEQDLFENISGTAVDVENAIDVVDKKLLVGGETINEFNYLKAQQINIGFDSSQSKLSDSFNSKFLFLFLLKENIDSTKTYVWNRFDGEEQGSYFDTINFFATKIPAVVGADVIRGQYGGDFLRGYLRNFDSEYKYLYLGFWCKASFHDYKTAIERVYSILRTICFKEDIGIQYFTSYVDYYKDKYVIDNQGIENAGKILCIDNQGKVAPTENIPQKDIYQLGGVPVSQGSENAGKTLIIDDGGNVVPGTVTPQGVLTGVVQYYQTGKVYLSADLLAGSTVVLGAGWSGNLTDGFTHTPGNTEDLVIQYPTVSGKKYVVGTILGNASVTSIYVSIGDSPKVDTYNGVAVANIGIKSEGGYLKITPVSGYDSTVMVTLKEVVTQEESVSELVLYPRNVNHGNTTDDITGFWNVAIGAENTFRKNQNGSRNIALGYSALANFTSGTRNVGIGTFAMSQLKSGDYNIAIGSDSLWYINKAFDNIAIGMGAFNQMPSGAEFDAQENIAIGSGTIGGARVSAYDNVAIGHDAGRSSSVTSPNKNVSIGNYSGYYAKENNVAVGHNAARHTNGSQNVAIGAESGSVPNTEQNNSIAIGYNAKTTKSNQCVIGNSNVTEFILGGKKLVFNEGGSVTWEIIS